MATCERATAEERCTLRCAAHSCLRLSLHDFTRHLDSEFHIDLRIPRTGEGRGVRLARVTAAPILSTLKVVSSTRWWWRTGNKLMPRLLSSLMELLTFQSIVPDYFPQVFTGSL